ncbi:hypothetical protein OA85_01880 [Flavobacterium sp. AED]|nr:hypothetical protein OA85_01880 [Flavobacterium sp. AED]
MIYLLQVKELFYLKRISNFLSIVGSIYGGKVILFCNKNRAINFWLLLLGWNFFIVILNPKINRF